MLMTSVVGGKNAKTLKNIDWILWHIIKIRDFCSVKKLQNS